MPTEEQTEVSQSPEEVALEESLSLIDENKIKGILKLILGDAVDSLSEEDITKTIETLTEKIGQLIGIVSHFTTAGIIPFPAELLPDTEENSDNWLLDFKNIGRKITSRKLTNVTKIVYWIYIEGKAF